MKFFSLNAKPGKKEGFILSILIFLIFILGYIVISTVRQVENPQDKVTPSISQIADGFYRAAFEKDRDGDYRLLVDTIASVRRFIIAVVLLLFGILLGAHMKLPYVETFFLKFLTYADKIPAVLLLPIVFIAFGLGETSKIALILLGVFPTIALDTYLRAKSVPQELIIKGQTLAASDYEIICRIILPFIFPGALNTLRLNFKAIISYLIIGETLAASVGLGYRVFVVRRYVAMDIIIPYVLWMGLLMFTFDFILRMYIKKRYAWSEVN